MWWSFKTPRNNLDRKSYVALPSAGHDKHYFCLTPFQIITIFFLATTSISTSTAIAWARFRQSTPEQNYHSDLGHDPPVQLTSCGSTTVEARALGCRFELHNFAWVPPECYDEELSQEWDAQAWGFARTNDTPPAEDMISQVVAMRGELTHAWVPWSQHMAHCALIWKKYHRAVALNRPMDSWTSSYNHSEHCADMLINWELARSPGLYNSDLHLKFPTCGYQWRHQGREMELSIAKGKTLLSGSEHNHAHDK